MNDTRLHLFDERALDELVLRARAAPRRRQNFNLHPALDDPIQRLLNAGEPDTYVRPHRHRPGRWELVAVLRGQIDTLLFDDTGAVTARYALTVGNCIEVPGAAWHSFVFALPGTIALEIKPGPYDAQLDKEFAAWAPVEDAADAAACARWIATAQVGARWGC
ncbi:MAG TPA: WbuC family cupin fold metalloprotein [Stellaceae bacterium]|nr:WbuC family cupin fold metalloprotein [Stellaceae bacterium]